MKILMLSWEYPPRIVGGISRVVHDLAQTMARQGNEVHVVTCWEHGTMEEEKDKDVYVHRVHPYDIGTDYFVTWIMQLNFAILERAVELCNQVDFDVIHAHDWLVAYAAKTLKNSHKVPLIATIHATEHGRNHGLHNDMQRYISSVEWLLAYESWKVICNSQYMKNEVRHVFQVPEDKLAVINNGVEVNKFEGIERDYNFRRNYAYDNEKILLFVGRLVQEKGVQVFIDAIPKIMSYYNDVKIVIVGKGPQMDYLKHKAYEMGIAHKVFFTGYINDDDLKKLYKCADVAVFPSLYEPFGIVALEGMVANVPVVVTDTCGLGEIVDHGIDGMKAYTGNANSLADCIVEILYNPELADKMRENALRKVQTNYNWEKISNETLDVYRQIIQETNKEDSGNRKNAVKQKLSSSKKTVTKKIAKSKDEDIKNETSEVSSTLKNQVTLEEMVIRNRKSKSDFIELH
ncbi:MAG: glycosyltransferase family 4 protein [Ignavibacteriales bacterium]